MTSMWNRVLALVMVGGVAAVASQDRTPTEFDVASVRLADPDTRGSSMEVTASRFAVRNRSLESLLLFAFETNPYQIQMPLSLRSQRTTIEATLPNGSRREQIPAMLRALLAERFGLATHVESRMIPAYDLVVAATGIRMRAVEAADELERKDFPSGGALGGDVTENDVRTIASVRSIRTVTRRTTWELAFADAGHMRLEATRMTMRELAGVLRDYVERPVFDRTGSEGLYQFTLELPMQPATARVFQVTGQTANVRGEPFDFTGPSVPKSVEKIGLKLEPRRDPVDVIVVDSINPAPTPN